MDSSILIDLHKQTMPYGKYKGVVIKQLPMHYLEWLYHSKHMPNGRLGMLLHTMYEIRLNGLMEILQKVPHGQ